MADYSNEEIASMVKELEQWRKFGDYNQMVKNVCYMSMVLNYMTSDPNLNDILIAIMCKFNEKAETDEETSWLERQIGDIKFD